MNVQALMNSNVKYAGTDASVADVITVMEKNACGAVPIVNAQNKVVGMITDRDICLALGRRPLPAAAIPVAEVMSRRVYACGPDEEVLAIDGNGQLVGILSMDDIVLHAESGRAEKVEQTPEPSYGQTVDTLKAIYKRPGAKKELIARP